MRAVGKTHTVAVEVLGWHIYQLLLSAFTCRPTPPHLSSIASRHRCGCVLVANHNRELLGIYTDGDLRRTIQTRNGNIMGLRVGDVMTRTPRQCAPDLKAVEAMQVRAGVWILGSLQRWFEGGLALCAL